MSGTSLDDIAGGLSGLSFLIVDDQKFVRSMVRSILEGVPQCTVIEATNGEQALQRLLDFQVDGVLLDISMRPMNGLQLLQHIRMGSSGVDRSVPAVMLTGVNDMSVVRIAGALDCNGFLLKPVSRRDLFQRLERARDRPWNLRDKKYYKEIKVPDEIALDEGAVAGPEATADGKPVARPGHEITQVKVGALRPNDRVLEDIRTTKGSVMVTTGTDLTPGIIDRLSDLKQMVSMDEVTVEREKKK